jgi:hypothetical protein
MGIRAQGSGFRVPGVRGSRSTVYDVGFGP